MAVPATGSPPKQTNVFKKQTFPEESHYRELVETQRSIVESLRLQEVEINAKIAEKSGGRDEYTKERNSLRNRLREITKLISMAEDERRAVADRDTITDNGNQFLRNKVEILQKSIRYRNENEVEEKIKELEYTKMTTSLPIKQEKSIDAQIAKLKKMIPEIKEYNKLQNQLNIPTMQPDMGDRERRNELRDRLKNLRDERDLIQTKLQNLDSARSMQTAPIRDLLEQREQIRDNVSQHLKKIADLQSEAREKETNYRNATNRKRLAEIELERFNRQLSSLEKEKDHIRSLIANVTECASDRIKDNASRLLYYLESQINAHERLRNNNNEPRIAAEVCHSPVSETITLNNEEYTIHRKVKNEGVAPAKSRKTKKNHKSTPMSDFMNHTPESLRELESLRVSIPKTFEEAKLTIEELQNVIKDRQRALDLTIEARRERMKELEARLKGLLEREEKLKANAPPGSKEL